MSWTKRQFAEQALDEIGIASYAYEIQPEMIQSVLRRMDSMLATWNAKGIRVGYPVPTTPENSDLDDETNVPDSANEAIYLNLAIRIAPSFGKTILIDTKISAKQAYNALLVHTSEIVEMKYPTTLPLGAGNKPFRNNAGEFITNNEESLEVGNDGNLNFE